MSQAKDTSISAYLVVSRGETKGKRFEIPQGESLIGRWDPDAGAFPEVDLENHDPEAKVSRRHALLHFDGSNLSLEDAGSMNGTFVNRGKRLEEGARHALKDGDEVIIGKTFLTVELN
ncbi:MAG: FHA domain-containing protein [Bdellovibrionales bacterium]|nr:FHA domain-containing protein [Bdellovibrionales bacterium]